MTPSKRQLKKLEGRVQRLTAYMESASYQKKRDKFLFMFGVCLFGSWCHMMGSHANDLFYPFYCLVVTFMIAARYVEFRMNNMHYFYYDFCYLGSAIVVAFIQFFPKNEYFFRLAFYYSTGVLAISTAVFGNALIFHKFQNMVGLILHPAPLVCLWNVK